MQILWAVAYGKNNIDTEFHPWKTFLKSFPRNQNGVWQNDSTNTMQGNTTVRYYMFERSILTM